MKPIQSLAEAQLSAEYMVSTLADTFKISREQAKKRIDALYKSGILQGGHPENPETQRKIDEFLAIER